jgi:hypothetical protein
MLRRSELPLFSELPTFENDPALFDPSTERFAPGREPSLREDRENDDGLGLRSLVEQPEALRAAWRTRDRGRRGKLRHRCRSPED